MAFRGVFPAPRVEPSPYGLFSAAKVIRHGGSDDHWAGGYEVESEACNFDASIVDVCGGPAIPLINKTGDWFQKVRPFGIRVEDECLAVGFDLAERKARIMRQLDLVSQKAVEAELWNGLYAQTIDPDGQFLSATGVPTVSATPVSVALGVGLLEQALADCGPGIQGVIHVPHVAITPMGDKIAQGDDKQFMTYAGNVVAAGAGYDGRGPGETTAPVDKTQPWLYATGPVTVRLGQGELMTPDGRSAVDSRTNETRMVGIRPASVSWDGCCHFAVQVNLTAG